MKAMDILETMGSIRDKYVLEAHNQTAATKKRIPSKRLLLIAAIISLLLLLMGCAAVLIGLQKISLGRVTVPQYSQPGWTMDIVSTNGYVESVNYKATQEWIEFINSYDQDRSLEHAKDTNGYSSPEDYRIYNCYTPEMQTKVDEIAQKYDLQLAGPIYFTKEPNEVFSAVSFGYLDGQYVLGMYSETSHPNPVIINGEESTLEQMNRIYNLNVDENDSGKSVQRIRRYFDGGTWQMQTLNGEIYTLDDSFDFEHILWKE